MASLARGHPPLFPCPVGQATSSPPLMVTCPVRSSLRALRGLGRERREGLGRGEGVPVRGFGFRFGGCGGGMAALPVCDAGLQGDFVLNGGGVARPRLLVARSAFLRLRSTAAAPPAMAFAPATVPNAGPFPSYAALQTPFPRAQTGIAGLHMR